MDIPVDAGVYCTHGPCGRSAWVILDPVTEEVTHVVVQEKHSSYIKRLVPIALVMDTKDHLIRLCCTADELARMERARSF